MKLLKTLNFKVRKYTLEVLNFAGIKFSDFREIK